MSEREPTPYERAGMAWWNSMSHRDRARWLKIANTCVVAEAYDCYVALLEAFNGAEEPVDRRLFFADVLQS
jgi:hypothetical protein